MNSEFLHLYTFKFPAAFEGNLDWEIDAHADILVYTGPRVHQEARMVNDGGSVQYVFFWETDKPMWANPADYVALRDDQGSVIEHREVSSLLRNQH